MAFVPKFRARHAAVDDARLRRRHTITAGSVGAYICQVAADHAGIRSRGAGNAAAFARDAAHARDNAIAAQRRAQRQILRRT